MPDAAGKTPGSSEGREDVFNMLSRQKLMIWLALALFTAPAMASPVVYVINGSQQFGTVDLNTGTFRQIGPNTQAGSSGLVPRPDGSLLTLAGIDLASINPATGL